MEDDRSTILNKFLTAIVKTPNTKGLFIEYCKKIVGLVDKTKLSIPDGAYDICGAATKLPDLNDTDVQNIMNIACDLELPDGIREIPVSDWNKLKAMIMNANLDHHL